MKRLEDDLQAGCVTWLRLQYPKLLFYHAKNEGNRASLVKKANGKSYSPDGSRNKRMGVLAGTPDLCIVRAKWGYAYPDDNHSWMAMSYGLYVELKAPDGRQSPAQKEFQTRCEHEGYKYAICRSFDEFKTLVETYLNS